MSIFTTVLSASNGVYTTGSLESSKPDGTADVRLVRDSTNIVDGDKLGKISFLAYDGTPGDLPLSGAFIEARAVNNWTTQYRQATDLRIGVQTNENNVDRTLTPAIVISGSDASVGFEVGARAARVQVGVANDGGVGGQGDDKGLLRVSSTLDNTGIDIDPKNGAGKFGFVRFYNNSGYSTQVPAIFVESNPSNANDKFNIGRWADNGEHISAIAVHNNANSVRIGGGGFGDANDTAAALVVTSSAANRKSTLRIASRHATRTSTNNPGICIDFKSASGNNSGAWWLQSGHDLVRAGTKVPLRFTSAAAGSSNAGGFYAAMTLAQGGSDTRVGVGGSNGSWPSTPYPRSMDPTGSFHIENRVTNVLGLTSDLEHGQLLLGNSVNSTNREFAELSFDVSTDFNKEKRTAAITVVRDEDNADSSIHKGKLHIRLDDGSGNKDSTRTRLRLDDQGGLLILSGTHVQQGAGYPNVRDNYMVVGDDVPSGSITLIAQGGLTNAKPEVIPTLNFMLYTGTSDSDTSRAILQDDGLGRIQWWSNDNDLTTQSEKVSAYIEVIAPEDHNATNKSPGQMSFYVRNDGGATPEESIRLSMDGDLQVFKNLRLIGNTIKAADGTDAITLSNSSGDVTTGGKLNTDFVVSKSTNITLDAVGDIILSADGDEITMDDGTTTRFTFKLNSPPELDAQTAVAKLADVELYTTAAKEKLQKFITDEFRIVEFVNNSTGQITNGTGDGAARRYLFSNLGSKGDKSTDYRRNSSGFEVRNQSTTANGDTSSTYKWQPPSTSERFEQYNSMAWTCPADLKITGMMITCHGESKLKPNGASGNVDADILVSIARATPTQSYITAGDAGLSFLSDSFVASGGDKLLDGNYGTLFDDFEPGTSQFIDLSSAGASMSTTLTAGSKIYMAFKVVYDSSSNIFYQYSQTADTTQTNAYASSGYLNYSVRLSGYYI